MPIQVHCQQSPFYLCSRGPSALCLSSGQGLASDAHVLGPSRCPHLCCAQTTAVELLLLTLQRSQPLQHDAAKRAADVSSTSFKSLKALDQFTVPSMTSGELNVALGNVCARTRCGASVLSKASRCCSEAWRDGKEAPASTRISVAGEPGTELEAYPGGSVWLRSKWY
eukprot:scaffold442_cov397-Prasinococcus_capsulatus_cf.AAC.14